jgi:hypothetical protein
MKRFPTLTLEGGLLAADLIEAIAAGTAPGQKPADFGLDSRRHLTDEIAAAWGAARGHWQAFRARLEHLPPDDPATSVTRDQWLVPFLSLLGYTLVYTPRAAGVDGRSYAISHRALPPEGAREPAEGLPVHLVGYRQMLDRRPESGPARMAPHSLMQEYLNHSEHLWGIVSNGRTLRVLRDSLRLHRPAYLEFDLEQMLEGEHFPDFALLFRLLHRSRLPRTPEEADECFLERYYRMTLEQGGRVRDRLRDGVEEALRALGNGFLSHPQNDPFRKRVRAGEVDPVAFYGQLLRLIYRLLFLMVAEERNLITASPVYRHHYSVARLRERARVPEAYNEHPDLWLGLQTTFRLFQDEDLARFLDVPPLNGDLFDPQGTALLNDLLLSNRDLLLAVWHLSMYREDERTPWRRVNYVALDVEELGSVYESLLDFHPLFTADDPPRFQLAWGTERKSTGSYYTPPDLVHELIRSALEPVLQERLRKARTREDKEKAILSLKVCDPACGSGHFLLAAARRLGRELARVRTGEEEPPPETVRQAVRDVITHCLYGVDRNPLAVDLCKVALWIEGHAQGRPLTFLDHRIRCGDSLVGVLDLSVLPHGLPDGAFEPISGDDRGVAQALKRRNRQEREGQRGLFAPPRPLPPQVEPALLTLPDDTPEQVRRKREAFARARARGSDWWKTATACHLWTAAFFQDLTREAVAAAEEQAITTDTVRRYLESEAVDGRIVGRAWELASRHRFFHWPLEFPEVFASPLTSPAARERGGGGGEAAGGGVRAGFDVVLCNPPWERIKLQEEEFFATRDPAIARAPNKAARQRLIQALPRGNPALWGEYRRALRDAEALSKFLRGSHRFPLTARGDINTYSVFAELFTALVNDRGRVGVVLPTGIATDATNQQFFRHLVDTGRLVSLYDFENREGLFPSIHRSYKFSLLTLTGKPARQSEFAFFLTRTEQMGDPQRRFTLAPEDLALLNPNTRTCPVFRTRQDAELTKAVYRRVPVLVNEISGENPWGVRFLRMLDMANDSHLFRTREELEKAGYRQVGNRFLPPAGGEGLYLPLYEAKMIWHYDHRFGTYAGVTSRSDTHLPTPTPEDHADPAFVVQPWYWVPAEEVEARLSDWKRGWLLGFRDVTNATNERTAVFSLLPRVGVGHTMPILLADEATALEMCALLTNLNSLVFDWPLRQKIGGMHLTFFTLRQLPVLPPRAYTPEDLGVIVPRVLELVYTAWDVKPFADDVWREAGEDLRARIRRQWEENAAETGGHRWEPPDWAELAPDGIPLPPFRWDEDRRARLRAELDAIYARLYGLTRKQLRYILDPADLTEKELADILDPWEEVADPLDPRGYEERCRRSTFPGETFRVLKEKELRQYGEYRTRRQVLEAWEKGPITS